MSVLSNAAMGKSCMFILIIASGFEHEAHRELCFAEVLYKSCSIDKVSQAVLDRKRLQGPGNSSCGFTQSQGHLEVKLHSHWPSCFSSPLPSLTLIGQIWFTVCFSSIVTQDCVWPGSGETGKETGYGSGCGTVPPCLIREERKWTHLVIVWLCSEARWAKVPEGYEEVTLDKCPELAGLSASPFHFTKMYFLLGFFLFPCLNCKAYLVHRETSLLWMKSNYGNSFRKSSGHQQGLKCTGWKNPCLFSHYLTGLTLNLPSITSHTTLVSLSRVSYLQTSSPHCWFPNCFCCCF